MNKIFQIIIIIVIAAFILGAAFYFLNISPEKEIKEEQGFGGKDREEETGETAENKEAEENKGIEDNWQWLNNQEKLYKLSEAETNLVLSQLLERFPDPLERLKSLAILRLGTPYQLGCLGEGAGRDKDPIFRLDITDCTVFVLTNLSLLHSHTIDEAEERIKALNYHSSDNISFENRFHFTTDRNNSLPYFEDITEAVGETKTKTKSVVLNKARAGERLIDINWQKEITIQYIASEDINKELFSKLPTAVNIAFLKEDDGTIGLDVRHEAFLFDRALLVHASSAKGKVVSENFFDYYFNKEGNARFDGIILFELYE